MPNADGELSKYLKADETRILHEQDWEEQLKPKSEDPFSRIYCIYFGAFTGAWFEEEKKDGRKSLLSQ